MLQAGTHFHNFANARLTQRAEFVRGGRFWTFVPKVDVGVAPYEGAATEPKGSVAVGGESQPHLAAQPQDQKVAPHQKKQAAARTVGSQTTTYTTFAGALQQWRGCNRTKGICGRGWGKSTTPRRPTARPKGCPSPKKKNKPQQEQLGPKRRLTPLVQGPCSSGAPYNRRTFWSCNACSTESASLSRTRPVPA